MGDTNALAHGGPVPSEQVTQTSYGGGTDAVGVFAGAAAIDQISTVAANNGHSVIFNTRASIFTELCGGPVVDDLCCWSIRATFACQGITGPSLLDHGIFILQGNYNAWAAGAGAGIQFGPTDVAEIRMRAKVTAAGAVTVNDIVAAALTPNLALYNTYELRAISGSNVTQPVCFGLINGQVATPKRQFGAAAALLPGPSKVGGFYGYSFGLINISAGVVPHMWVHEIVITGAQKEADLF